MYKISIADTMYILVFSCVEKSSCVNVPLVHEYIGLKLAMVVSCGLVGWAFLGQ